MVEERLKDMILQKYKSIREFSMDVNLPYTTIDSILKRGVEKANVINIIKICNTLGIDTEMLAEGEIVCKTKSPSSNKDDRLSEIIKILEPLNDTELLDLEQYIDFLIYKRERELGLR